MATVFGTLAAIGFFSMRRKPRAFFMGVNNIPMTNADIITGVSLMLLFVFFTQILNDLVYFVGMQTGFWLPVDFHLGFITLLLAHITFDTPYVILSVLPCLRQLDKNLSEAAQDLGATPMQAFTKVVLPQLRPGIINGAIIAFTMSVDDFVISYFTAGADVSNLAMEGLLHGAASHQSGDQRDLHDPVHHRDDPADRHQRPLHPPGTGGGKAASRAAAGRFPLSSHRIE